MSLSIHLYMIPIYVGIIIRRYDINGTLWTLWTLY